MEINWFVIAGVAVGAIIVIIFLFTRNVKDEKNYEDFLNKNEQVTHKEETEINDSEHEE